MPHFARSGTAPDVPPPVASVRPAHPAGSRVISDNGEPVPPDDPALERRVHEFGAAFLDTARRHKSSMLSAQFWSDKLMDWAMKDGAFKVQLFRFVDAFPMLKTPDQVHDHLVDYLTQPGVVPPPMLSVSLKAGGFVKGAMAKTVTKRISAMADRFIAGVDAMSALKELRRLWNDGIAFSIDLLGEACLSDEEAESYQKRYLDLVEKLPGAVASWPARDVLEHDHLGPLPRANVSIKISSLYAHAHPVDPEGSIRGLMTMIVPVLEAARRNNVFINFDMEQVEDKDLTLDLFMRCCEAVDFEAGIAMQAYLRSGDDDARRVIDWAKSTGRQVTVRLVKGAYWDYETINAEQMGWPVPVWSRKADTDACFERMTARFIEAMPRRADEGGVKLALGSHNVRSIAVGQALLEKHDLPQEAMELQMLHGMADQLKGAAVEQGWRVREYVPVGETIPGMAYLVRRLLENTSNESWLKAGFLDNATEDELLASPHRRYATDPGVARLAHAPERHALSPAVEGVGNERPFFNEPLRDFSDAAQRERFARAVRDSSLEPVANDTTVEQAKAAAGRAADAFARWRDTNPRERAHVLTQAAQLMRDRRDEISALVIRDSGKTWSDADADVCEAIDFCDYYARCAVPLFGRERLGRFIGELNEQWHQPRGVAVVISPWNFPLAICTGMTTAALVTGNTVLVKPAEQTSATAKVMCDILWRAGAPREVLHFVPGVGETVGAALVRDPRVALIAFTGSKAVGLDIVQAAGVTPDEQPFVKQVICEMGGKNAIIVDASADLDEAVPAVEKSAFGYQGQRCSACSRAIVVDSAHDAFLHRLVESSRSLVIGDPLQPGTDVGPVIDEDAAEKIRRYVEIGRQEGTLELSLPVPDGLAAKVGRPYVGPHVFSGIERHHRLANEEIFGPVLSVMRVRDFDEALEVANATDYKLTGGVFSRKPSHLDRAKREFRVGNLYLNRAITGALVARQPFGGFGLSGVGTKAGGEEYLLHFVVPRVSCENTMRRGFAPGLD